MLIRTTGQKSSFIVDCLFKNPKILRLPVLISDTTPWRNLEGRSVGRDIPLSEGELFVEYIEYFYSLDSGQQLAFRDSVHRFAEELRGDDSVIENNLNLFRAATHFKS